MCPDNSLKNTDRRNQHLRDILILLFIALALGTYLVLTTVVVSRDSVAYVMRAHWLQDNLAHELAARPSGYELLILLSYRLFYAITGNGSVQGWIWAAQGLTLLCKALAVVALYLAGCLIARRKSSFWGCVILLLLPEPAQWGSDILRIWPYVLFVALSILFLLYGLRKNRAWPFILVGVFAGIGFLIRLESLHLLLLCLWVLSLILIKRPKDYLPPKALAAIILLFAGFAGPNLVYAHYSDQIINNYLKQYIAKLLPMVNDSIADELSKPDSAETNPAIDPMPEVEAVNESDITNEEEPETEVNKGLSGFAYELYKDTGELLVWFYLPFWVTGIYCRLRNKADPMVRYLIGALILMGTGMILMRYFLVESIVSKRWVFSLIAVTAFYIYTGIEQTALWIERKKAPNCQTPQKWIRILVTVGILICLSKCFTPLGAGKKNYLEAADWISTNSQECDWFYTFDTRIPFYAERHHLLYDGVNAFLNPFDMKYLIIPAKDERSMAHLPEGMAPEASFGSEGEPRKEFLIYKIEAPE